MGYGHKVSDFVQEIKRCTTVTTQQPIKNWNGDFGRDTEYFACGQSMFEPTIYHPGTVQLNKGIVVFSKGLNKLIHCQFKYYQLKWSCGYTGIANI